MQLLAIWWLLKTHASIDPVGSHCVWTSHHQLWIAMIFTPHTTSMYFTLYTTSMYLTPQISTESPTICPSPTVQYCAPAPPGRFNFLRNTICQLPTSGSLQSATQWWQEWPGLLHTWVQDHNVSEVIEKFFKVNHSCGKINLARQALWLIDPSYLVKRISAI